MYQIINLDTVFEQLKNKLQKYKLSAIHFFVLGAISKLAATSITYPYIVIKSRMQVKSKEYNSVSSAIKQIIKQEGIKGLYKGIESKILQSVLTAAFLFAAKEKSVSFSLWLLNKKQINR